MTPEWKMTLTIWTGTDRNGEPDGSIEGVPYWIIPQSVLDKCDDPDAYLAAADPVKLSRVLFIPEMRAWLCSRLETATA